MHVVLHITSGTAWEPLWDTRLLVGFGVNNGIGRTNQPLQLQTSRLEH